MAFVLVVIMACEKSAIGVDEIQTVKDDVLLSKGEKDSKVTICHYDADLGESYQITISANGLNGHDGHLDDNIPEFEGEVYIALGDDDGDGIIDCADCNVSGEFEDATSEKTKYYLDNDGDGFGNPSISIEKCYFGNSSYTFGNDTYVLDNTDCYDDDANLFPYTPAGTYVFLQTYNGIDYYFDFVITSNGDGTFTGNGIYPAVGSRDAINRDLIPGETYANLITLTIVPTSEEGIYDMNMLYTDGIDTGNSRDFVIHTAEDCSGIISFEIDGQGDWSLATTQYDPTGCYTFWQTNSDGTRLYEHYFIFNDFDGTNYTGTGHYWTGSAYAEWYDITATVDESGVLTGNQITISNTARFFRFTGTVYKYGIGIATIDPTVNLASPGDDSSDAAVGLHWEFEDMDCSNVPE